MYMKRKFAWLCLAGCLCLPMAAEAQQTQDDSRYLAGAVPEVNGKVVFTRQFSIPGMSQDEIYQRAEAWLDARLKQNENNSRITYAKPEEGLIVGMGDDWIVFSSTALALDRTRILYQVTLHTAFERCDLEISRIRYLYREGKEKYEAEEWVVDKYALNKTQTKLVRGLAKWRRKTVDFMDEYATSLADAFSKVYTVKETETVVPSNRPPLYDKPIVVQAKPAEAVNPVQEVIPVSQPVTEAPKAAASSTLREVKPEELPIDAIQSNKGRLVITIGTDPFDCTNLTAGAGGSLGRVSGSPVVFTILSPEQNYQALEKADTYTVRFYPNGSKEPSLILQCEKAPAPAAIDGMPRTYVGRIIKAEMQ